MTTYCRSRKHQYLRCAVCGGKGQVSKSSAMQGHWMETCPACRGAGEIPSCSC